jgi:hypothetical protein
MRSIVLLLAAILTTTVGFSQDMKVSWEDDDGREFSIMVLSGEFGFSMIPGDDVKYDYHDKVTKVGDVTIRYDYHDKVTKVGDVTIRYDYHDKVTKVGGLSIRYDYHNKITGTRGSVR